MVKTNRAVQKSGESYPGEKNTSARVSPLSARETPGIQRRGGMPGQRNRTIIEIGQHMSCKATDAMISDPPLIGIDHGRTIERAAPVNASCDMICVQSRSPRTNAPVGSL